MSLTDWLPLNAVEWPHLQDIETTLLNHFNTWLGDCFTSSSNQGLKLKRDLVFPTFFLEDVSSSLEITMPLSDERSATYCTTRYTSRIGSRLLPLVNADTLLPWIAGMNGSQPIDSKVVQCVFFTGPTYGLVLSLIRTQKLWPFQKSYTSIIRDWPIYSELKRTSFLTEL